jgi:hypothetical protein
MTSLPRRVATTARLIVFHFIGALGYLIGLAAGALTTLALWFVGAVIAGYRTGRGGS